MIALMVGLSAPTRPALAQGRADQAAENYAAARAAWDREDYEEALALLERAFAADHKPVYAFNIGRALEQLGRLVEARNAYLRVKALERGETDLATLATGKAAELEALVTRGILRLGDLAKGSVVQVDGEGAGAVETDLVIDPGSHVVCVTGPQGARAACHRVRLPAGVRQTWPPSTATGSIEMNEAARAASRVLLNGQPLLVAPAGLRAITVDVGRHLVDLELPDGDPVALEANVLPDATAALEPRQTEPSDGPGIAPWITLGAGVAAVGAGVTLMVIASQKVTPDSSETADGKPFVTSVSQATHAARHREAQRFQTAGIAVAAVGAAAVIGGVLWGVLGAASGDDDGPAASPETSAGLAIDGSSVLFVTGGSF